MKCDNCGEPVKRLRWWEKLLVNPLVAAMMRQPWYVHDSQATAIGGIRLNGVSEDCDSLIRFEKHLAEESGQNPGENDGIR